MSNALQTTKDPRGQLVAKFANKFGVDTGQVANILKATAFKLPAKSNEQPGEVSNEQLAALLIVADQYGLNPFTREIYAFPDKQKGIVPIVGVDGWSRIINDHKAFDGVEFRYSDEVKQIDENAKECPVWIEAVIYRKDRSKPTVIREYLDECYRPAFEGEGRNGKPYKINGPWQTHTRRFLRHKALIQGARVAFGFSGIFDEDEGERVAEGKIIDVGAAAPKVHTQAMVDFFHEQVEAMDLKEDEVLALEAFVDSTAVANGCTVEELEAEAGQQFKAFIVSFRGWQAKNSSANAKKEKAPKQPEKLREPAPDEEPKEPIAPCIQDAKRLVTRKECFNCEQAKETKCEGVDFSQA